jgi:hypothetical protein
MNSLFENFSEDYFKMQEDLNAFLQRREKLALASAKVVDMNKQKKVILEKLLQVLLFFYESREIILIYFFNYYIDSID